MKGKASLTNWSNFPLCRPHLARLLPDLPQPLPRGQREQRRDSVGPQPLLVAVFLHEAPENYVLNEDFDEYLSEIPVLKVSRAQDGARAWVPLWRAVAVADPQGAEVGLIRLWESDDNRQLCFLKPTSFKC